MNFSLTTSLLVYLIGKLIKQIKKLGSKAGYLKKTGYIYISINKQECAAHRVAWLLVTKKDPWPYEVDHIKP